MQWEGLVREAFPKWACWLECREPRPAMELKKQKRQEEVQSKKTHRPPGRRRRMLEQIVAKWEYWNADFVEPHERSGDDCKQV